MTHSNNNGIVIDRVDIVQALGQPWADEGGGGDAGGNGAALASAVGGAMGALTVAAGAFWWLGGFSAARKALCGAARFSPMAVEAAKRAAPRSYGASSPASGEAELNQPLRAAGGEA